MCKGPLAKLVLGFVLICAGVYAILPGNFLPPILGISQGFAWEAFKTVLLGAIPPMLAFLGLLIVWIEIEEIKIERAEREIEKREEEKKSEEKKKITRRKRKR
jgi:hypothetical protein